MLEDILNLWKLIILINIIRSDMPIVYNSIICEEADNSNTND